MKCLTLSALILVGTLNLNAQEVKESAAYQNEKLVYQMGLRYGDINIARNALYNMMALDRKDVSLLDSLAYLYYDYQKHTSCILVCLDLLKLNPNHLPALEMSAISYENLGLKDKALASYESLYLKESSIYTLYKVAVLQLDLDRLGESKTNVDILLKNDGIDEAKIAMNTQQGPKEISLKAAVFNLKGLIEIDQDQKEAAKASFNEAISLEPDFTMAKNNLAGLDQ